MKSKFPLFIALIVGAGALLAVRSYVNNVEQHARAELSGDSVFIASVDVPKGADLTRQMLGAKQVPRQFTPAQAVPATTARMQEIVGQKTAVDLRAGQIILTSDLVRDVVGGLSTIIKPDLRAFTASITKGIKPGLIVPGDHIDILGSFASPKPSQAMPSTMSTWRQASDMVNVVLLQNVKVIAVGDNFADAFGSSKGGSDLTLELTLPEAQLLMFATEHGELGAVLRNETSVDVKPREELKRITFEDVEKVIGDLDGARMMRLVEIQNGPNSMQVPVLNKAATGDKP